MKKKYLETVDSTNLWAKEHAAEYDEDLLIYTDNQVSGYGRFGRTWQSPKGSNLAFSLLLSPPVSMQYWPNCSQVVAVALATYFFEHLGLSPTLKWPNDILFNDKKAVGILAESITLNEGSSRLIIGVGINVCENKMIAREVDRPVTSLQAQGSTSTALALMEKIEPLICTALEQYYEKGFALFAQAWRSLGEAKGREVSLLLGDTTITGVIAAVHDDGSLSLEEKNGVVHAVTSGEIEFITSNTASLNE